MRLYYGMVFISLAIDRIFPGSIKTLLGIGFPNS